MTVLSFFTFEIHAKAEQLPDCVNTQQHMGNVQSAVSTHHADQHKNIDHKNTSASCCIANCVQSILPTTFMMGFIPQSDKISFYLSPIYLGQQTQPQPRPPWFKL